MVAILWGAISTSDANMLQSRGRRLVLRSVVAAPFSAALYGHASEVDRLQSSEAEFAALEEAAGGRLGVKAYNAADGMQIGFRADERFPMCSTFKIMLVGAILARSKDDLKLLRRRMTYRQSLVVYFTQNEAAAKWKDAVVAQAARIAVNALR